MPAVMDIEQSLQLLELEPPFDKRQVQLARRRQAKMWHPDLAPPGKQVAHERHLKAINQAADQLESLAEGSRGGRVSRNAVKVSAAAARAARAEAGRRAYEEEQAARAHDTERKKHDPFGTRMPDHSVVHRYARCLSYPEWGVGSVNGIYFTGAGDDIQQWARVKFNLGIRTVPADSLRFVDFSKPDPAAERVERFLVAAQHAMHEGDYKLAAQRLIYARDAEPENIPVLRLMTLAFWQAAEHEAAARAVRDWARNDRNNPAVHRFASRIYEDMGALDLAVESAEKVVTTGPHDASAYERIGRLYLAQFKRDKALDALEQARKLGPSVEGLLDLALAYQLSGDIGGEVTAAEQATLIDRDSSLAWTRYAHALARTDRVSDALAAASHAHELVPDDEEVAALVENLRNLQPRALPA
jgi:tetratricopeptide (TPR) repeat protein